MFLIRYPAQEASDTAKYVCRFKHVNSGQSAAITYLPGTTLRTDGRLAWVDDRTVAWLEVQSAMGETRTVTPRGRLKLASQVGGLTLDELFSPPSEGRGPEFWQPRVAMARWVTDQRTEDRLLALTRHLARRLKSHRSEEGTLLSSLVALFDEVSPNDGSRVLDVLHFLHAYNRLLKLTKGTGWEHWQDRQDQQWRTSDLEQLDARLGRLDRMPLCSALRVSVQSVLRSRVEGSQVAQALRRLPGVHGVLGDEVGALTYGMVPDTIDLPSPRFRGIAGFDFQPASKPVIMYSGNPAFLRAYVTRLASTILIFPEFDFHLLILGDEEECRRFGADVRRYIEDSAHLRGQPLVSSLSMSWAPVPPEIVQPKSYFASARFMFADSHLTAFPAGLWIHDVDLYPTADITPFLSALRLCDIGIAISRRQGGMTPWKRFLAGNVFLNETPAARDFLAHASEYLRHWLVEDGSWMVDQNALSWAAEQARNVKYFDMMAAKVPLTQSTLASRIERGLP